MAEKQERINDLTHQNKETAFQREFSFSENTSLEDIRKLQEEFAAERNWNQYHTPRNLLLALVGEYILPYKLDPTANYIDPYLPLHNALADLGLCSLLGVISRTYNIDPDLTHYATADQGICFLQLDLTYRVPKTLKFKEKVDISPRASERQFIFFRMDPWKGEVKEGLPDFTEEERKHVGQEMSDVLVYLVRLADKCRIDLSAAALEKIQLNAEKYPVHKVYGKSDKYTEYKIDVIETDAEDSISA